MHRVSRRAALAACSALVLPATSGCSSYIPWSEASPEFDSWLPGGEISNSEKTTVTYENFDSLVTKLPQDHELLQEVLALSEQYGVPSPTIDGQLTVDTDDGLATILTGPFDRDAVLERREADAAELDSLGAFRFLGETQAVGPGAFVVSSSARTFIETHQGERERIQELDDDWAGVLQDVAGSDLIRIVAPPDERYHLLGLGLDVEEESSFLGTAYGYYENAEAATLHASDLLPHVGDLASNDVQTTFRGVEQTENVVAVDVEFWSIPF